MTMLFHFLKKIGEALAQICPFSGTRLSLFLTVFTKQESSRLRQEFWTVFGQYMSPLLSAEEEKVNWINYKTGLKDFSFRMNADNKLAVIAIELTHNDKILQQIYFEQLQQMKNLLEDKLGEEWDWRLLTNNGSGKLVSRVEKTITDLSIYRKQDWPALISFFKPRIIALDNFWSDVKYAFEML